ncbi:MAG: DUF1080 domain-containing protein [Bryobacteraceae bacterium]|nr:DUF1080 domain-containing protein [Bryobacteraceae bacterium]MDW8378151.1 DUF1080 domain-containing protein [Bryobacterales bacterium]
MRSLLCILALSLGQAAEPNILTPEEKASGWRLLFDGKSFQGWIDLSTLQPPGRSWTIEDGCLKATAKPRIREDLFTTESFGDFELAFEWKISPRGNSGVKYRIQDRFFIDERRLLTGRFLRFEDLANDSIRSRATPRAQATQEYIVGFEYQVIDDEGHPDARRGAYYQAGALYDMIGASQPAAKKPGEFNQARIVVRGNHIEHWLNGVKVVDGDLDAPETLARAAKRWTAESPIYKALATQPKRRTPIALQNHNDEAWFRSLKIRPFK